MSMIVARSTQKVTTEPVNVKTELSRWWLISVETVDASGRAASFRITRADGHSVVDGPGVPFALANLDKMVDEARP